jgi:hypothetical protein
METNDNYTKSLELYTYLIKQGFVDITKEDPIHFHEQLPVTFDNIYTLDYRFKRDNDVLTTICYGIDSHYNVAHIIIESHYNECMSRFCEQMPIEYILKYIQSFIDRTEDYVKRFYN